MRKVFHVAVNSAWFKKSQRKWDFLLQLSVSLWIPLFAYRRRVFTSVTVHIRTDIFLGWGGGGGGNLTVFGVDFFEPRLKISDLFTFICRRHSGRVLFSQ